MRIDTRQRKDIETRGLRALKDICEAEAERLTGLLKVATDMNSVRHYQGQLSILDKIISLD